MVVPSKLWKFESILLLALEATLSLASKRFDGCQMLHMQPLAQAQVKFLKKLQVEQDLDYWKDPIINRFADIMMSPENLP